MLNDLKLLQSAYIHHDGVHDCVELIQTSLNEDCKKIKKS